MCQQLQQEHDKVVADYQELLESYHTTLDTNKVRIHTREKYLITWNFREVGIFHDTLISWFSENCNIVVT